MNDYRSLTNLNYVWYFITFLSLLVCFYFFFHFCFCFGKSIFSFGYIIKKILDSSPLERVSTGFLSYLHCFTQYNPCFIHVLWCRYKFLFLFLFESQIGVSLECDNVQVTIEAVQLFMGYILELNAETLVLRSSY